jgi:CrcB protein
LYRAVETVDHVEPVFWYLLQPMSRSPRIAVAVFLGGMAGTLARFAIGEAMFLLGLSTLVPILLVNITGALILGWFAERARHAAPWSTPVVAFVGVGLLGSFTTFSAFSVETVELLRSGAWLGGTLYVVLSVVGGMAAALQGRRMATQG